MSFRSKVAALLSLAAADLATDGLVQLGALSPELGAEEAVDEDVGGRVDHQEDVADADRDQGPGIVQGQVSQGIVQSEYKFLRE